MEIKEVKKKGNNWFKELLIILCSLFLAMLFSLHSEAAGDLWNQQYSGDDINFIYYYGNDMSSKADSYDNRFWHIEFDKNVYYLPYSVSGQNYFIAVNDEPFTYYFRKRTASGGLYETQQSITASKNMVNGKEIYTVSTYFLNGYEWNNIISNLGSRETIEVNNAFISYFTSDDFVGYVPEPDLSDIESVGSYSEYIPTPKITVDNVGYGFGFNNAADNYYFELQGRWYSVDDIELYKENLQWKYKYSTLIKSSLTSWVNASDKMLATDGYDFAELGSTSFQAFLTSYPIDNRTYYGGTNAVGNYFSGYNNAMDTIKMLLNAPESLFNGLEIYIRYFTIDDKGNVNYGKWCHWYDALADSGGSSGSEIDDKQNMHSESQSESGLTTDQKESLEETGDSKSDTDVITQYINNSPDEIASKKIWEVMQSMISAMGVFPILVSTVFGWLPSWLINMIAVSLASLIILRFLGR